MTTLLLKRTESNAQGTFGELCDENMRQACTCERPDNGNQKMGCIPPGEYKVTQFNSPSKGQVFLVHDVPGRDMIEIHNGNTLTDTEGCILVGSMFGDFSDVKGVTNSRATLARLLMKYPAGFTLQITEAF